MKKYLFQCMLLIIATQAYSQQPKWAFQFETGSNAISRDVAFGSSGAIYSCGYFYDSLKKNSSEPIHISSQGKADLYIAKHDQNGNLLWLTPYGATGDDRDYSIILDEEQNIYVGGSFKDTLINQNKDSIFSAGDYDGLILKLDSNGSIKWTKTFGGKNNDEAYKLALLSDGSIAVGGYFTKNIDITTTSGTKSHSSNMATPLLLKINTDGEILWTTHIITGNNAYIYGITEAENGSIALTGSFSDYIDNPTKVRTYSVGLKDIFVAKTDASGNYNSLNTWGSSADDAGYGIIYSQNFLHVAGGFEGQISLTSNSITKALRTQGERDGFLLKLDTALNVVASNTLGGQRDDRAYNIALTDDGILVVGSVQEDADMDASASIFSIKSQGLEDSYVAKYDFDLHVQWVQSMGGISRDIATGVASQGDNIAVSGLFGSHLNFAYSLDPQEITLLAQNSNNPFVVKLKDCNLSPKLSFIDSTIMTNQVADSYQWLKQGVSLIPLTNETAASYRPMEQGLYAVQMTNDGCTAVSEWILIKTLDITDRDQKNLKIWPNPVINTLHLQEGDTRIIKYHLTNMAGQVIISDHFSSTLYLGDLPQGTYFITIETEKETITKKLIKI